MNFSIGKELRKGGGMLMYWCIQFQCKRISEQTEDTQNCIRFVSFCTKTFFCSLLQFSCSLLLLRQCSFCLTLERLPMPLSHEVAMRHAPYNAEFSTPSFAPTSLLDYTELSIAKIVSSSMTFSKVGQPTVTNI